jgi:hypothetical protein
MVDNILLSCLILFNAAAGILWSEPLSSCSSCRIARFLMQFATRRASALCSCLLLDGVPLGLVVEDVPLALVSEEMPLALIAEGVPVGLVEEVLVPDISSSALGNEERIECVRKMQVRRCNVQLGEKAKKPK